MILVQYSFILFSPPAERKESAITPGFYLQGDSAFNPRIQFLMFFYEFLYNIHILFHFPTGTHGAPWYMYYILAMYFYIMVAVAVGTASNIYQKSDVFSHARTHDYMCRSDYTGLNIKSSIYSNS